MKNKKCIRQQVLGSLAIMLFTVIAVATPFSKSLFATVPGGKIENSKVIKCKLLNAEGKPFEVSKMERFHICDLLNRPFQLSPEFSEGEITFLPVETPFRISLPVEVPGFGEVFLYADNRGDGYTAEFLDEKDFLFLNYEFAADRLETIKKKISELRKMGVKPSDGFQERYKAAEQFFKKCRRAKGDEKEMSKWCMESLRESLYAGEMIVIEKAKHLIAERGQRKGFLFGCNAFQFKNYGDDYTKQFESLFNFATLPYYMGGIQRTEGQFNYSRVNSIIDAMENTQIITKGHPLIFLVPNSTPDWVKNQPYERVKEICTDYIKHTIHQFKGRVHIWDVVNEAHVQPDTQYGDAIIPDYNKKKAVDMSCAAAKAAREADPTCFRIVNCTGTWADYYMGKNPKPWQQSPYDYLQMLEDARCEYEAIGLQYYHSGRDLLEFERDLERFAHFNKPIHITELQIPSSSENIPGKDWWGGGKGGAGFKWHGDRFTETIQADWIEAVYNILYSKSYIEAVTYWDMTDPAFVPHGGIVDENGKPKEGYFRLKKLIEKWNNM